MEQRRLLIALVVSFLVIIGYQELIRIYYKPPPPRPKTEAPREPAPTAPPAPAGPLAAPLGETPNVEVETDTLRIRITPTGGRLAAVELKTYRRTVDPDSPPLDLVEPGPVLPGTLQLGADRSDATLQYRPDRTELSVHGTDRGDVVLTADGPDGLQWRKRYRFTGNGYLFELEASVSGNGRPSTLGLVVTPLPADAPHAHGQSAIALADHRVETPIADLLKEPVRLEAAHWAGFATQYFLSVGLMPGGPAPAMFTASDGTPITRVDAPLGDNPATFSFFTGPKDHGLLTEADHELARAIDFGWFAFVAIPLLHALRLLNRALGNYGFAIIVLTAVIKVVTAPLTRTTFRNMREMQKIQPQMAKLRERFKDDQVALQKEMMELYRRHRVNPFSGCLPMLLQLPIFIGLYSTLSHAIELRHAPFALWINDLSAPDKLFIAGFGVPVLTLLMGASMFVQQWLTPAQGDPTQQRMMMFMPLIFTFMFMNMPAGLVLYWLVNNILTIAQQWMMMRDMK